MRFDDFGASHAKVRCYATLAVPLTPGEADSFIERPVIEGSPDRWTFRMRVRDRSYRGEWRPDALTIVREAP